MASVCKRAHARTRRRYRVTSSHGVREQLTTVYVCLCARLCVHGPDPYHVSHVQRVFLTNLRTQPRTEAPANRK